MSDDLKERVEQIMELKPSDDIHKMRIQAWKMACIIKELAEREVKLKMEVEDLKRTRQVAIDMAADKSNNCILAQEREAKLVECVRFYASDYGVLGKAIAEAILKELGIEGDK